LIANLIILPKNRMKPRLPHEIVLLFPKETIGIIYSYVPHLNKPEVRELSPTFEKDIKRIQNIKVKGKNEMFMRDFDDFILDV